MCLSNVVEYGSNSLLKGASQLKYQWHCPIVAKGIL